jgi:hypothetical protein
VPERIAAEPAAQRTPTARAAEPAARASRDSVLGLQRQAGNSAVQKALSLMRESVPEQLQPAVRAPFEQTLGGPLDDVRIHTDRPSLRAASLLGASAFTHGRDIFLGAGPRDTRLMTHELVHALQGEPAREAPSAASIVPRHDVREREASAAATAVASGGSPSPVVERAEAHEILRDDTPPAGYREGVDPDVPLIEEDRPDPEADEVFEQAGIGPLQYRISIRQPDAFLVPATSPREQIANGLFGDAARTNDFDFVSPARDITPGKVQEVAVRVRTPTALLPYPLLMLQAMLDVAVRDDVLWTVSKLKERVITDHDEWALVSRCLLWAQRYDVADPAGVTFFDRYLNGLAAVTLSQPHWYTLTITETSHTALEWLLIETSEKAEQIKKAIELRSVAWRGTTGYSLTAAPGSELPANEVIGRFYWSQGSGAGSGIQLRILERIADEPTRERAEIQVRNAPFLGIRVVIPAGDRWYGYSVLLPDLDPLVTAPAADPEGRYYWYFPGTILVRENEFQPDYPTLGADEQKLRRSLLDQAMSSATADNIVPLLGLDYDALAQATLQERLTMLNTVLFAHQHGDLAFELAGRIVQSVPDAEFPQFERLFTTSGLLNRVLVWNHEEKIALGRAFTLKVLSSMPVGVDAFAHVETLQIGKDTDDVRHMADTAVETVSSRLVAPADWGQTQAAQIGAEPALPTETAGPIERPVLRFKPLTYEVGIFTKPHPLPPTRQFLPTELVRLEIVGAEPQTRIASAFEVALIASIPDMSIFGEALMTAVNAALWARAGIGITKAFGPALAGGLAEGGLAAALRAAATVAGTAAGRQALKAFLWDVLILGSMTVVDRYRDELERTPEGRAFLELYDVAMTVLIVRDVYKLLSSGVLTELASRGVAALRVLGAGARAGLVRAVDDMQAFALAWKRLGEAGELVEVEAPGGFKSSRPRSEGTFRQFFYSARAELTAARVVGGLAGSARTVAQRVFDQLERLAAKNEEVARAFSAVTKRVEGMSGKAAEEYLLGVERLLGSRRPIEGIAGFVRGSARLAKSAAYLTEVETLLARTAVSNDAITELGRKAGAGQLDVEWLNGTKLTDDELTFLGADPKTPWKLFQSAAGNPEEMRWATSRLRGIAAEMVTKDARRLVPGFRVTGRQVAMGTSEIDFSLTSVDGAGRRRGMEVKGWIKSTWQEALDAFQKASRGARTSKAEKKAMEKIEHMLGQLQNARAATRNPPVLVVTDDLSGTVRTQLDDVLRTNAPRGTEVVTIPEDAIKNLRRHLSQAMGLE